MENSTWRPRRAPSTSGCRSGCATRSVPHDWLVHPDARPMTCYRPEGQRYTLVLEAEGDAVVAQPGFSALVVSLAEL